MIGVKAIGNSALLSRTSPVLYLQNDWRKYDELEGI
jgi:hypothetical protein